jgi:hypothetical protein
MITPEQILKGLEEDAKDDFIGLWEVISRAEELNDGIEGADLQATTLDLVKRMLSRGFRAGNIVGRGGEFEPWSTQDPDIVLPLIEKTWNELGRTPSILDIVDFDRGDTDSKVR